MERYQRMLSPLKYLSFIILVLLVMPFNVALAANKFGCSRHLLLKLRAHIDFNKDGELIKNKSTLSFRAAAGAKIYFLGLGYNAQVYRVIPSNADPYIVKVYHATNQDLINSEEEKIESAESKAKNDEISLASI